MTISEGIFRDLVYTWLESKLIDLGSFYTLNGGWEAWVQAEVAVFTKKNNNKYDILREQPIYASSYERVDWVLNLNNSSTTIGIELKCESVYSNYFLGAVYSDLEKIAKEVNPKALLYIYVLAYAPKTDSIMTKYNLYNLRYELNNKYNNRIFFYVITRMQYENWLIYKKLLPNEELLQWSKFQNGDGQLYTE